MVDNERRRAREARERFWRGQAGAEQHRWREEAKADLRQIIDLCYSAWPSGGETRAGFAAKLAEVARQAMSLKAKAEE